MLSMGMKLTSSKQKREAAGEIKEILPQKGGGGCLHKL